MEREGTRTWRSMSIMAIKNLAVKKKKKNLAVAGV
jgi:hypothetical protein